MSRSGYCIDLIPIRPGLSFSLAKSPQRNLCILSLSMEKSIRRISLGWMAIPQATGSNVRPRLVTQASTVGSRVVDADNGAGALTEFEVLERFDDGTSLVKCVPRTGAYKSDSYSLEPFGIPDLRRSTYKAVDGKGELNSPNTPAESARQTLSLDDPPMCLHAWKIELRHPISKEMFEISSDQPAWCEAISGRSLWPVLCKSMKHVRGRVLANASDRTKNHIGKER